MKDIFSWLLCVLPSIVATELAIREAGCTSTTFANGVFSKSCSSYDTTEPSCSITVTSQITVPTTETLYKTVTISGSLPVASHEDTITVPTTETLYKTITIGGSLPVSTHEDTITLPATILYSYSTAVSISEETTSYPVTYTKYTTIFESGIASVSTYYVTTTFPVSTVTAVSYSTKTDLSVSEEVVPYPTTYTQYSEVSGNGTTSVSTYYVTTTIPASTVTAASYSVETDISVSRTVVTLPGPTVSITEPAVTQPGPTLSVPPITITAPPITTTVIATANPPIALGSCSIGGPFPSVGSEACGNETCHLAFESGAAIRWTPPPADYPPVATRVTFLAPRQTCVTTSCNTDVFNEYYSTSFSSCATPPCPSNTVDCDCNFVFGPLVLPGGTTTSITQTGAEGWYLNLGPSAAGTDIPTASCGVPGCVSSTATEFISPVVYTGYVSSTVNANLTGAVATEYLLPDLPSYFPSGNPFGSCTNAIILEPTPDSQVKMLKRQDNIISSSDTKVLTIPGAPTITGQTALILTPVSTSSPTALPDTLSASSSNSISPPSSTVGSSPGSSDVSSPGSSSPPSSVATLSATASPSATTANTGNPPTTNSGSTAISSSSSTLNDVSTTSNTGGSTTPTSIPSSKSTSVTASSFGPQSSASSATLSQSGSTVTATTSFNQSGSVSSGLGAQASSVAGEIASYICSIIDCAGTTTAAQRDNIPSSTTTSVSNSTSTSTSTSACSTTQLEDNYVTTLLISLLATSLVALGML